MSASPARPQLVPASSSRWAWLGAGFALASALFGAYLLLAPPSSSVRVVSTPPPRPTPPPIVVHIAGEVRSPGIYELSPNARLDDAVRAAGGTTELANIDGLNLAARLSDGQRLVVPRLAGQPSAEAAAKGAPEVRLSGARLNLNTASLAELDALPGIGPVIAQRIIEQRQKGLFTSVDQLLEMKLVNSATFGRIRDSITVE